MIRALWALPAVCAALAFSPVRAAQPYASASIPEELSKDAVAVVRDYQVSFTRPDMVNATERQMLVITVLNANGDAAAALSIQTDKFTTLKSFSGEIFDSFGNSIRRIKRADLQFTEASQHLATDNSAYYYEPYRGSYPYTVKYEWECSWRNGIFYFPLFCPMQVARCAVEKASYRLVLPAGTPFHARVLNMDDQGSKTSEGGNDVWNWRLDNAPGVIPEPYSPPFTELYPLVYLSPHDFVYDGVSGCMDSWDGYGRWQWKLLEGRNVLPEAAKQEIDKMTAGASTPMEKIRILYDYLAATTRYVSIQIGIGGYRPMAAAEVHRSKFGDCKALSNYMQAMLSHAGIESYYTEIGLGPRRVIPDFANVYQTNHVILQVPLPGDTLWLECTAPDLPLGFTHDGLAGRYGLVYRDGTAIPTMVAAYADSLHLIETRATLTLAADGSFSGHVSKARHLDRYDDIRRFGRMDNKERVNYLLGEISVASAQVSAVTYAETKSRTPFSETEFDIQGMALGSATGSRRFVPLMPLMKHSPTRFGKTARRTPVVIEHGGLSRSEVTITLPEGAVVETFPRPVSLQTPFGEYSLEVVPADGGVVVRRRMLLRTGRYGIEQFPEFKSFMEAVAKSDAATMVIKNG